jgi:hypothetical protein
MPLHWATMQSFAVCVMSGVPAAVKLSMHVMFVHVGVLQSVGMPQ